MNTISIPQSPVNGASEKTGILPSFVQVPLQVLTDPRLSPIAKVLAAYLLSYTRPGRTFAYPSQDTVAADLQCSPDTVQRALKELKDAAYLFIKRTRKDNGHLGRNEYDLSPLMAIVDAIINAVKSAVHTAGKRLGQFKPFSKSAPAMPHIRGIRKQSESISKKEQYKHADASIVISLTHRGVSESEAWELVGTVPEECRRQLRNPWAKKKGTGGALVSAIKGKYDFYEEDQQVEPEPVRHSRIVTAPKTEPPPKPVQCAVSGPEAISDALAGLSPTERFKRLQAKKEGK